MKQPTIHQQFIKGEFVELVELSAFHAISERYAETFKCADLLIQAFDILTAPQAVQASWGDASMRHKLEATNAYKRAKEDLLHVLCTQKEE
jgi:hypothetical protein